LEDTYLCADCNQILYGEQSISHHMGVHQRMHPKNRTCKLKGCPSRGHTFATNTGYSTHEVSVVLGQIHSTYNAAPSEAKVMQPLLPRPVLESLLVNKVPVVASKVVVVKKAVTEMKLTARP
jgi:hypothetical protein